MKKLIVALLLLLATPGVAQNWGASMVSSTSTGIGVYTNMPLDTYNYPWAQSVTFTFTSADSSNNTFVDSCNDPTFPANCISTKIHFNGNPGTHSDALSVTPVIGESWCTSTSAGRYFRLRTGVTGSTTVSVLVTLSPGSCQYNAVQGVSVITVGQAWPVVISQAIPFGATAQSCNGSGSTAAVQCNLPAVSGKTTFICSFDVSAIGGTAAVSPIVVGPVLSASAPNSSGTNTLTYQLASSAGGVTMSKLFTPCHPASTTNTGIFVETTADGTATAVNVNVFGYTQ